MKHSIRQRVLDPVTGLKVTGTFTVNGELGSGVFDANDREIFEGDKVTVWEGYGDSEDDSYIDTVIFVDGVFKLKDSDLLLREIEQADLELSGHVDD